MKRSLFSTLALSVLIVSTAFAQQESVDLEAIYKIKREGINNSQVMETAFYLTDFIGPRLSGSTGLQRSYNWTKDKLAEWGLEDANIEEWGEFGRGWEIEKSYIAMKSPYYQALIGTPKAWTPGTNGLIQAEAMIVSVATEADLDDYKGRLSGKIVLLQGEHTVNTEFDADATRRDDESLEQLSNYPQLGGRRSNFTPAQLAQFRASRALRQKVAQFIKDEGAAAVLSVSVHRSAGKHGTHYNSNGASYRTNAGEVLPEIEMISEHYNRIHRLLSKDIKVELEMEVETRFLDEDLKGYNVIAEIPGTDRSLKSELVMLGGHLDSWHPATGATDNAAGVAVAMEAVRILQAIDAKPKRTIRIALWGSEEQGLFGSRGYVEKHFGDRRTLELKRDHEKVSGYFNLDNGTGKIRGIYLQGNDQVKPIFEAWLAPFKDLGVTTVTLRNTGGTDHLAFDAVGLPGFQFIQDGIDYGSRSHHTNMDTYERLQAGDLIQASVVMASMIYHTANRSEKLPRKPLPQRQGTN